MFVPSASVKSSVVTLGNAGYAGQIVRVGAGPGGQNQLERLEVTVGNNKRLTDGSIENGAPAVAKGLYVANSVVGGERKYSADYGAYLVCQAINATGDWSVIERSGNWEREA